MDQRRAIERYFRVTPTLAALCSQNGWPDNDTLKVDVVGSSAQGVICTVAFEEILVEGAGCVAGRVPCFGRFIVTVDGAGQVICAEREA
ncbi:MAG: hypothetical protein ACYCXG_07600 [Acidiferrobacter sp.]